MSFARYLGNPSTNPTTIQNVDVIDRTSRCVDLASDKVMTIETLEYARTLKESGYILEFN